MTPARQGLAFPFRIDPASQHTTRTGYAAHVDQMVRQLLLTTPGERINLPQFGCGLRSLVFAPTSDALAATIKLRVIQGLNQWLADAVHVLDVVVAGDPSAAVPEPGTIVVTVTYTLLETQTNHAVTVNVA